MAIFALSSVTIALLICNLVAGNDPRSYLYNSERFPTNDEEVPTLSNGNLGFVVHGDSVFLTGVYNGAHEESKRARIPNYSNLRLEECDPRAVENQPSCSYQLDMRFGRFRTVYEDAGRQLRVVHDVYAHRYFSHAIVNRFRLQRLSSEGVLYANILQIPPVLSPDVTLWPPVQKTLLGRSFWARCGYTNVVEDSTLQTGLNDVCIYYMDYPTQLELPADRTSQDYFFYTTYGRSAEFAERDAFLMTMVNDLDVLHSDIMNQAWDQWGISVEGNPELDRAIKASAFQLFSNIPSSSASQVFAYDAFGISSDGIGRNAFQGHNQWDYDMWIFPLIALIEPFTARDMLRYRVTTTSAAAKRNADQNGFRGWQYPWSSGFTGRELAPMDERFVNLRYHVTADVAFAARFMFTALDDLAWMQTTGCSFAYETAQFWMNHTVYNEVTDRFEIHGVTGPDDTHPFVKNNAFTNVVAAHNLLFGEFAGCLCRHSLELSEGEWTEMARRAKSLMLPYNSTLDFHPQFEDFTPGTPVSQADAVLLGYPLQLPMPDSTKRNNLEIYGAALPTDAPPMTWAMHAIGWLDLDEPEKAAADLTKSYRPFLRAPFNIWNQKPAGVATPGAPNYVTGAAGFLQAIVNGYAGIRLHAEQMVIKPRLPPGTTGLRIPRITYMRINFSLNVHANGFMITFGRALTDPQFRVFVDGLEHEMCSEGCLFTAKQNVTLVLARREPVFGNCRLQPLAMDMDYSGGSTTSVSMVALTTLLLVGMLGKWL